MNAQLDSSDGKASQAALLHQLSAAAAMLPQPHSSFFTACAVSGKCSLFVRYSTERQDPACP